ncbi:MAG: GNAT family N-acetyltransferase [Clostridium fessum]
MFELIKESDLDTVRHFYRALAGTEFCAWTDIYPGEPELQSDFSRDSLFCIRDDVSGRSRGWFRSMMIRRWNRLLCWSEELQPSAEISRLGVAEKYQNRGIARELLAGAMEELRRRGCKSAHMLVAKDNVKALRSYEKLAFEKVGEYVLQGHDYWCFEKKL